MSVSNSSLVVSMGIGNVFYPARSDSCQAHSVPVRIWPLAIAFPRSTLPPWRKLMPKIRAVCPECAAVLALAESITPGRNIRCPKCPTVVPLPHEAAATGPARSARSAGSRPRRFKPTKQGSQAGIVAAFIAASILILAGAGVGGYVLFKSNRGGGATAQKRPTPTDVQTGIEVGQIAQDISAEDIDGVPFKLSDYRGKVVVLDFWGHW